MNIMTRTSVCLVAAVLVLAFAAPASAQYLAEQNAAMNINNTLQGGSTGGYVPGVDPRNVRSSQYMQQPAYQPPPVNPYNPNPYNPYNPTPFNPGVAYPGAPGMQPAMPITPTAPPVKKILVLTGERVMCHVIPNLLLEDIHYEYRPESEKGEYYDDGTHKDLVANDNIYTNYTDRSDVLSPEANRIKLVYLRMLEVCEDTNPLEFFRIPVATEEPLSALPRVSEEEKDRDETFLRQWHRQFLSLYRQDQEDPKSDFFPIFVPSAPRPPETPAPPNEEFNANAFALDSMIQNMVDQVTAPAVEQIDNTGQRTGRTRRESGSSGEGGSSTYSGGDRWGQLRQDARSLSSSYGAGSSRYFR